jgi:hypothetical protein
MQEPKLESITPKKAAAYLNRNNTNRTLRPGVVERYAYDMVNGHWTDCAAPIVFYEDGDIGDGQHRLFAITESGTTQKFLVIRDFPREAGLNIDTGLGRTLVDNARISGLDTELSNQLVAVVRAYADGHRSKKGPGQALSNHARLEMVDKYREPCAWAVKHGPRAKGLNVGLVTAALARAYTHEKDKERLARYAEVLSTGFGDGDKDSAAIAMRNWLLDPVNRGSIRLDAGWNDAFLKVQNSIHYFVRGKPLFIIKKVGDERYPLKG